MSKLRGAWLVLSILAVVHLLAASGVLAVLCLNGTLTLERVELIAAVLRGEHDEPAEDAAVSAGVSAGQAGTAEAAIARGQQEDEIFRLQMERQKTEMSQRLDLVLREMARVQQEREYFEELRRRDAESANSAERQHYWEGFQKQLDLFGKMKPKVAVDYLLSRDVEEAATLLRALDTRKGKKIVEAATNPSQRKKMDEILKLLPELDVTPGGTGPQS